MSTRAIVAAVLIAAAALALASTLSEGENSPFPDLSSEGSAERFTVTVVEDECVSVERGGAHFTGGTYSKGTIISLSAHVTDNMKDSFDYKRHMFDGWFNENGVRLSESAMYTFTVNGDVTLYAASSGGRIANDLYVEEGVWTLNSLGYTIVKDHLTGKVAFEGNLSLFSGTDVNLKAGRYDIYKSIFGLEIPMIDNSKVFDGRYQKTFSWRYGGQEYSFSISGNYKDIDEHINTGVDRWPTSDKGYQSYIDAEGVRPVAQKLMSLCRGLPDEQKCTFILRFVQANVSYLHDYEFLGKEKTERVDYWKLPLHTLLCGNGDCEDTATLLCSLYKACGFKSALIVYDTAASGAKSGHAVAAVALSGMDHGAYYDKGGLRYYYCEGGSSNLKVGGTGTFEIEGKLDTYYVKGKMPEHMILVRWPGLAHGRRRARKPFHLIGTVRHSDL